MKTVDKVKARARIDVARSMAYKRVYKYLTYESGIKMLSYTNLQFTRANELDDKTDCHISKINFDCVKTLEPHLNSEDLITAIHNKHEKPISSFGICSLGTTAHNKELWNMYTKTDDISNGICIELDHNAIIGYFIQEKIMVCSLKVDYIDTTIESIPYELLAFGTPYEKNKFMRLLFATKTKSKWEKQEEVRIIIPEELTEKYQRYRLSANCFKGVYLGS